MSDLSALYADYDKACDAVKERAQNLLVRAMAYEAAAAEGPARSAELLALARSLRAERGGLPAASWVNMVARPLAELLRCAAGMKHVVVHGPAGLSVSVFIDLYDEDLDDLALLHTIERMGLVVRPYVAENGRVRLVYETGKTTDRYAKGTVGYENRLNEVTAALPNKIGEVVKLLKPVSPLLERKQGGKHEKDNCRGK